MYNSWFFNGYSRETNLGIDISKNKIVSLNTSHDRLVITDINKNPVRYDIGVGENLTAVFQRKKAKRRSGDGNPLIYALKELNRFTISEADKTLLYDDMKKIVKAHYLAQDFDSVVILPSSKPITKWVGKACSEVLNIPLEEYVFIKATNAAVLKQLRVVDNDREIVVLRKLLESKKSSGAFNMKDLSQHQRAFVKPVLINPYFNKRFSSILMVDDLVSSGTTFRASYNAYKSLFSSTKIECLSLLGPVT